MVQPLDISKFRKGITKSINHISTGFNDPRIWVSTGNYCLDYLISGEFDKGVPLGKVTCFAGESGSGKSYICSGNLVRNAQAKGIFVVLMDSENALDETWLQAIGVDTSPEAMLRIAVTYVDDVAKVINEFMKEYKSEFTGKDDDPAVLFVVDSLGMLQTPTSVEQFEKGNMKGDMGIKAKQLKALVSNCVNMLAPYNVGLVATNHVYASQDMFNPDDKISGGEGFVFASSIIVASRKKKLKEDEFGNKGTDILGIKSACKVVKTRYAKPFETVDIYIPYESGMNPYSGLFDMFERMGIITKVGMKHTYVSKATGEEFKEFKKNWRNKTEWLDLIMEEFTEEDMLVAIHNDMDGDDND